jgi:hypothetical protein
MSLSMDEMNRRMNAALATLDIQTDDRAVKMGNIFLKTAIAKGSRVLDVLIEKHPNATVLIQYAGFKKVLEGMRKDQDQYPQTLQTTIYRMLSILAPDEYQPQVEILEDDEEVQGPAVPPVSAPAPTNAEQTNKPNAQHEVRSVMQELPPKAQPTNEPKNVPSHPAKPRSVESEPLLVEMLPDDQPTKKLTAFTRNAALTQYMNGHPGPRDVTALISWLKDFYCARYLGSCPKADAILFFLKQHKPEAGISVTDYLRQVPAGESESLAKLIGGNRLSLLSRKPWGLKQIIKLFKYENLPTDATASQNTKRMYNPLNP